MRKAINENPAVQVALLAVLGIGVALLLITRLGGGGGSEPAAPAPTADSPAPSTEASRAAPATGAAPAAPSPEQSSPGTAPAAPSGGSTTAPGALEFTAGPGLPKEVVKAYENGKTIALIIFRRKGVDDLPVHLWAKGVNEAQGEASLPDRAETFLGKLAVFTTPVHRVARYSRIALGVDLDRAPALVVVKSRKRDGGAPSATVSYGFRGIDSFLQAIKDAMYQGRQLPYYPE